MENPTLRNWEMVKHIILMKWDRLDAIELERTHGNFREIIDLIQNKYDAPKETIVQELSNLAQQMKWDIS